MLASQIPDPQFRGAGLVIRASVPDRCFACGGRLTLAEEGEDGIDVYACDCGHKEHVKRGPC